MNKVKIYLPITTDEQRFIKDEIAKSLKNKYDIVIIHFLSSCNYSIIEVLVHDMSVHEVRFFKNFVDSISDRVGESILLQIHQELEYIGRMQGD